MFLTYSFRRDSDWWLWGAKPFSAADQKVARYALKQWGDACGIRFLEVKKGDADIKFGWLDPFSPTTVAWADFPETETAWGFEPGEVLERNNPTCYVRVNPDWREELSNNKSYKTFVLLHEIGHTLGLKHPFHKMTYNKMLLSKADDSTKNTVMSYDNEGSQIYPTTLSPLDKQAIKALYGSSKMDGKHLSKWSWNKGTETLTQIGKAGADKIHGTAVQDLIKGLDGNDRLLGYGGDDTLVGGAGCDTLAGGDGSDTFVFDTALDALSNVDEIADFDGWDTIQLSSAIFTILPTGFLSASHFSRSGKAADADDWIILDENTKSLFYDPDGSGPIEKILFARLKMSGLGALAASDFLVV